MQKIISLFMRDYDTHLVYDEIVPGAEWVVAGEGVATRKWDGTCCLIRDGKLYRRYDRKLNRKTGKHKDAPEGWEAAQEPDAKTGHWPGWLPVGAGPEDKWHREAMVDGLSDGTRELCGPKIGTNAESFSQHVLIPHGRDSWTLFTQPNPERTFCGLKEWFGHKDIEGLVWHHPDGRMVKIKKRDFGLERKV